MKKSIESEVFCVLFCEEEEKEESSRVLESIQEKTSKLKVFFLFFFFQSFFLFLFLFFFLSFFLIYCFLFGKRCPRRSKLKFGFLRQKKVELKLNHFFSIVEVLLALRVAMELVQ